jgi:hypothetical protein
VGAFRDVMDHTSALKARVTLDFPEISLRLETARHAFRPRFSSSSELMRRYPLCICAWNPAILLRLRNSGRNVAEYYPQALEKNGFSGAFSG